MNAEVLWTPPLDGTSRIQEFTAWVNKTRGLSLDDYDSLWQWSVTDLEGFWSAVHEWFDIPGDGSATPALGDARMPGADWFPRFSLNHAEVMLRMPGRADDDVVVVARSQTRDEVRLTAAELRDQVARARAGLLAHGVGRGDRVVAYSPNVPETHVMFLAAASLGAVFASCAPEFGTQSVVDRWRQIEPKVLLAVDGYRYGDKAIDRRGEVDTIREQLPSIETVVWLPYLYPDAAGPEGSIPWEQFTAGSGPLEFNRVPWSTPLYVLFSSGTTGLPKPIVHGHGGITIEHLKSHSLHSDLGPRDRFFWFSTTGWMMWNLMVSGIGVGATVIMFDGNPVHPDTGALWRMADELGVTLFGTSAPFLLQCRKEGLVPRREAPLAMLKAIGSTGAPLPPEGFRWVHEQFGPDVQLSSTSGGTDLCAALVGTAPTVPVWTGEISCRVLGAAVEAFDPDGNPVRGELGELVVTEPMPSMPVGFWGDDDGQALHDAYFDTYPGIWRHGDWVTITERGSCVITGRSDATLNRGGVRLGTSEFYSVVESIPQILDSLVVHLEDPEGGAGQLVLFVALAEGRTLDYEMRSRINSDLRLKLSPRHVPDEIHQVRGMPRTLSGKKLEVPVKKILRGVDVDTAASKGSLQNPEVLDDFLPYRR